MPRTEPNSETAESIDARLRVYANAVRFQLFREPIRSMFPLIPDFGRQLLALQRFSRPFRRGPVAFERVGAQTGGCGPAEPVLYFYGSVGEAGRAVALDLRPDSLS
jgi:hypothetical protein